MDFTWLMFGDVKTFLKAFSLAEYIYSNVLERDVSA